MTPTRSSILRWKADALCGRRWVQVIVNGRRNDSAVDHPGEPEEWTQFELIESTTEGETMTYRLSSVKGTWEFEGTKSEAIARAKELQAEYQAAYGVDVVDDQDTTVATIE